MTIYFDENKEAYAQLETLERWGRSLLFNAVMKNIENI